ncbi:MAG: immune inhibitor A [Chitinophagaceae bacterium]|nr:immune inhibitor A [Chitinophagaceae bacterium]
MRTVSSTFFLKCIIAGFIILSANTSLFAQEMKYSEVKIFVPKTKLNTLWQYGLSFDHFSYDQKGKVLFTVVNQDDIALLNKYSIPYQVTEADAVTAFVRKNKNEDPYKYDDRKNLKKISARGFFESPDQPNSNVITTPAAFMNPAGSMGGYYTLAEVYTQINNMRTNYPGLVKIDTIGWTFGGNRAGAATPRPIWVVKISDNAATDEITESEALITGLNHAREGMSMMNIIFFMQYILENYSTNPGIKQLVDNRQLYFIPVSNPDGYKYNQDSNPAGGGLHRKNRTTTNVTTNIGTDINRNYEIGWNEIGIGGIAGNPGSSTVTTNDTYRGPSAMSELESQAMRAFLRTRRITMCFNHHSYAEAHIHPACVPSVTISAADADFMRNTSAAMTRYNFYTPGNPFTAIGAVARGSNDDYFYSGDLANRGKIFSYSPEIGPNGGGIGGSSFWPLSSQIIPLSKAMFFANYQLALTAGAYTSIEDRSPANITVTSGSFNFRVYRMGIVDSSTTVTLIPLENIQTVGSPVTIPGIANYLGSSDGSITYTLNGSVTNGSRVRFIWRTTTGGITQSDTIVRFYNGNTSGIAGFTDDMETGAVTTNWVVSSGWNYSTALMGGVGAFSGTRTLAESPADGALYANSATLTARINKTFNFTGVSSGYLTFWLKHRAENGNDYLRVQVSANGGTTWTTLAGKNTVAENAGAIGGVPSFTGQQDVWIREFIDLKNYMGGANSNVQIRFQFVSDAAGTDDGFFIDNVAVVTSSISTSLSVEFISFSGKTQDNTSILKWDASVDGSHSHFEVERSADRVSFVTIGVEKSLTAPFSFIDRQPGAGTNYYRIKQVSTSGSTKFSSILSLKNEQLKTTVKLFPNMNRGVFVLQLETPESSRLRLDYIDEYGRMLIQRAVNVTAGKTQVNQDVSALSNGIYYIKIVNDKNELISAERFIKY